MDLLQEKETLLAALPRLHTTPLGLTRLRRNLCLSEDTDPVAFCRDLLSREDCTVLHLGKNLYCRAENVLLTIHARSYTLITGRRIPVGETPLEEMGSFFDARLDIYDAHQLDCIDSARDFYPFTAAQLPRTPEAVILDLGCGTGLELEYYFALNPTARITGIDLAPGMLRALQQKFPHKVLTLIQGSYLKLPPGTDCYDGAVSVESLHHLSPEEKLPLYKKLHTALKDGSDFILSDYFASDEETETRCRRELLHQLRTQGLPSKGLYHFDTPLTREHETALLQEAGFSAVELLGQWAHTCTLRAKK